MVPWSICKIFILQNSYRSGKFHRTLTARKIRGIPIEPRKAIVVPSLLVVFLSTNEILQGHSKEDVFNRFDRDYFDILVKNWSIWTPVQLANFYFIPLIYRNRITFHEIFSNWTIPWYKARAGVHVNMQMIIFPKSDIHTRYFFLLEYFHIMEGSS